MRYVPKIIHGVGGSTTLTLTLPSKLWTPMSKPHGGSAVSDAGVPESFVIRRDQRVKLDIRFTEAEWIFVDSWLTWGQGAQSFHYWFDKNDVLTDYTVYLDEPNPGDGEVVPVRDSFTKHFAISVVLRTVNNGFFDVQIF